MIFAFDYETFYSKEYSVKDLGNWHYTHHPEFDPYLLSVVAEDGYEYCGAPTKFDWSLFEGNTVLSHNAGFEWAITQRLQELGRITSGVLWADMFDTADLAAFLGVPRSLAEASAYLLHRKADKAMRDRAKGKHWDEMDGPMQKLMKEYALTDSRNTLEIWLRWNSQWSEFEREISKRTREMCWRGLPVRPEKIAKAVRSLDSRIFNTKSSIPWVKEDPEGPVLSLKKAAIEARKHGIEPPSSFAKDSDEFTSWVEKHGDKFQWAAALGEYRSANMLQKKLETLKNRVDDKGSFRYSLKYFGAHTGRDSGDGGFNVQNPNKEVKFGVDLRGLMIAAPPGYTLAIMDESAIEPRVLACEAGDEEFVQKLREGMDPYEAQARTRGEYTDPRPLKEVDPDLRRFKKVEVLGLGYGAGPAKAQIIAKQQAGLDLPLEVWEGVVAKFRSRRFIPDLWSKLEEACRKSAPKEFEMELPSGRSMTYHEVKNFGSISAIIPRLGRMMRVKLWGGSLTENKIQAIARDIFMWHVLQIGDAGYEDQILLRAHDEVVVLVKEETAAQDLETMLGIMSQSPPWYPGFPAKAEGGLSNVYCKI